MELIHDNDINHIEENNDLDHTDPLTQPRLPTNAICRVAQGSAPTPASTGNSNPTSKFTYTSNSTPTSKSTPTSHTYDPQWLLDRLPLELVTCILDMFAYTCTKDKPFLAQLIRLSKATYDRLIPLLYREIRLNKDNAPLVFRGLGPKFDGPDPLREDYERYINKDDVRLYNREHPEWSAFKRKYALLGLYVETIYFEDFESLLLAFDASGIYGARASREINTGRGYLFQSGEHIAFGKDFFSSVKHTPKSLWSKLQDALDITMVDAICIHVPDKAEDIDVEIWQHFMIGVEELITVHNPSPYIFIAHNVGPGFHPFVSRCLLESRILIYFQQNSLFTLKQQTRTIMNDLGRLAELFNTGYDADDRHWIIPEYYNYLGAEEGDILPVDILDEAFPDGWPEDVEELLLCGPNEDVLPCRCELY